MAKSITFETISQEHEEKIEGITIEDILLAGARERVMIQLLKEREEFLKEHEHLFTEEHIKALVGNGFGKERKILTPLGELKVSVPRTKNRAEVRNDDGELVNYASKIIPQYMKRSMTLEETIPLLYLDGISTNDMQHALRALLGEKAHGLSASNISKMMREWEGEMKEWKTRPIEKDYCYLWVDGINFKVRNEEEKMSILVVLGATLDGRKELIAVEAGYRESKASWQTLLRDLKTRGMRPPKLCVGDGALGFWSAVSDIFPEARWQRCWVHKTANVLDKLPKRIQPKAKSMLHEIWMSEKKEYANAAFDRFIEVFGDKYPKATDCLLKDRDKLLTFYDFPAAHWKHIRTTNPIESTFATVRLRTKKTRGHGTRLMTEAMVFKLIEKAQGRWQRLSGYALILKVFKGVKYIDGEEAKAA